ncbi:MAG TPA: isochorismatase family protein [Opitutus sp.]|nr:isochorismatase family protein [Opitutus sp.]
MDAIIIVDLQKAFPVPPDIVRRIEERSRDFPLRVFTKFLNEPDSLFYRKLRRRSCLPGTAERELLIDPGGGDIVIDKRGYGFTAEQVEQLRAAGIGKALVCGVDTDACVLGVVFTLFDAGIDCEVESQLCWSSTGLHDEALTIVREQFGTG